MKKIAIHSVPRSGSTWLGSIFDSSPHVIYKYQPLFSFVFKNFLNEDSSREDINLFFEKIYSTHDYFIDQVDAKRKGLVPDFSKNDIKAVVYKEVRYHHIVHSLLDKHNDIIIIGLIRNPMAVIHSWLKAPKEFRGDLGWQVEDEWQFAPKKNESRIEEFNGYAKWKEVAIMFHKLQEIYPKRVCLVDYRKLLLETENEVDRIFSFCGLELTEQTTGFLQESTEKTVADHYSVFREKQTDDKWKSELPEYISEFIQKDLKGTLLQQYL